MTREKLIEQALDNAYYKIELVANPPETYEGGPDDRLETAVAAAITSHDGSVTLLVELSMDERGCPAVTARGLDVHGAPLAPLVLDTGESVLISMVS